MIMSIHMQVGLQVLLEDAHVFECHKDISDAVYNAELGSSAAIFRAGYTIDSLMLRYQGVDWTDPKNWQCNAKYAIQHTCEHTHVPDNFMRTVYFHKTHSAQPDVLACTMPSCHQLTWHPAY